MLSKQSIATLLCLKVMLAAILPRSLLSRPSLGRPLSLYGSFIPYSRLVSLCG